MTTETVNEKKDWLVIDQFNNRVFFILFSVYMVTNLSTHIFEDIGIVVCLSIVSQYSISLSQISNLICFCSDRIN